MKKIVFVISLVVIATLTACNLQAGPAQPAAQNPAPGGPAVAQSQNNGQAVQLGGQPQATSPPNSVQVTLPTITATANPQATPPPNTLTISDVQLSNNTFYFGYPGCGATHTTITVKVTSNVPVTKVGVLREFIGDKVGNNGGRSDFMTPIGNDRYSLTIPTPDYDNKNIPVDNYTVDLIFFAEDAAGHQVATGEWGDAVGDGHIWPLNPVQVQIPLLRQVYCYQQISQTEPVHVDIPITITPTPYLEPPTDTPAPVVQTRSGYVELGDWYATGETADMDFSGANELAYIAARSDDPRHGLGQNVNQGEGIMMARTSSPSYENCRAVSAWNTSIAPVQVGETYCYLTSGGTYGYFRIDKIENRGGEIAQWIIGLSYTVWIP